MHLSEEQIQRFLHDELDALSKKTLSQHVEGCGSCAKRLAEAEREEGVVFDLLRHVDHSAPRVEAGSFAPRRGALAAWGRRAAGIVVVATLAGAAYAIPGSPLRALVEQVAEWIAKDDAQAPLADQSPSATQPVTSGIAVPVAGRFTIEFTSEQAGTVAVSLTDEPNILVRVLGGTATFTADLDRLTIDNREATANYELEIPREASYVAVSVEMRQIVLKDGDTFAAGLATDERGHYVFPLSTSEH